MTFQITVIVPLGDKIDELGACNARHEGQHGADPQKAGGATFEGTDAVLMVIHATRLVECPDEQIVDLFFDTREAFDDECVVARH